MAEDRIIWTSQQDKAIRAGRTNVLVTASAGTGKTAVLSGRCARIVSDDYADAGVSDMLVLTFTEMAAEQMKERIAAQLRDTWRRTGQRRLYHQLVLLPGADIGTIHSFCKRLITGHFYRLGIDPTFRVIDADEATLLKAEVLEKTIDYAWRQDDLRAPLEHLLARRDLRTNDGFLARIIEINNLLDGVVSRPHWYQKAEHLSQMADPAAGRLGQEQRRMVTARLRRTLAALTYVLDLYERQAGSGDWAVTFRKDFVEPVSECLAAAEAGDWDRCTARIRSFQRPRFYEPTDIPRPLAELMHQTVTDTFKAFNKLTGLAVINPDYLQKVGAPATAQTATLIELVRLFDEFYSRAKQNLNCLDFADLEHHALRLLTSEGPDGKPTPTATALALRRKYRYIFVDEYQDINPVQQAVLDALGGDNIFVVGDLKQSIYAWRGAEPRIFLQRLKAAAEGAGPHVKVDLNINFRSAQGILDFANRLFGRIMTASFAGIDYDESAMLRPAPREQSPPRKTTHGPLVEFHVLDRNGRADSADEDAPDGRAITSRQLQAAMVARRIREMVGADGRGAQFQVYDGDLGQLRDVEYRDIVILMRSLVGNAADYLKVLRLAGVPVSCEAAAGYFETTEISDMLCLLKVLDNPRRDIELAAVLRSPIFGFTDTDLAKIKLHAKTQGSSGDFYSQVLEYASCGPDDRLARRLQETLARMDHWRRQARRTTLAGMIWQAYRDTDYLAFVSALPDGQARRANLLKLHDRAIQFEGFVTASGLPSLGRFVEFVEKLQQSGQDWSPAEPPASAGNAVSILSVHKGKGLEFPVVFLAELQTKFNTREISADCLADTQQTLGLQIIDPASGGKLKSLAHQVIAENKRATSLAEEMRILYVATTRAKSRLVLTACRQARSCRSTVTKGFYLPDGPLPDWILHDCTSPLDWLLYAFADQKVIHEALETGLPAERDQALFSFSFHDGAEPERLSTFIADRRTGKPARPRPDLDAEPPATGPDQTAQALSIIDQALAWRYPYDPAPAVPAKTSVSELTHHADEYARTDYTGALTRLPAAVAVGQADRRGPTVDQRLVGSATHLLIASLDLEQPITAQALERTKEQLLAAGALTTPAAARIDTRSILEFFQSDLGRAALDPRNKVHREWPFTYALPAVEWAGPSDAVGAGADLPADETIIVQGIIDMLIETPGRLIVIDFKTDRVTTGQALQRAQFYRAQLDTYARAAGAILGAAEVAEYLYFLAAARLVSLR